LKLIHLDSKKRPVFLEAIEDHGHFFLMRLKGDIETRAIEIWHDKMTEIIEDVKLHTRPVLCDFGKVMDVDTATVAALVRHFSEFRKKGGKKLILFNIQGELKSIFEITHMHEIFAVCASEKEAIAALGDDNPLKGK
jgi:anti-anti-sigma factor